VVVFFVSCVFRAYGPNFDVDRFLIKSTLSPCAVWHKGEPRFGAGGPTREHSGLNADVSDAGWDDLDRQIKDAMKFSRQYRSDIRRLSLNPKVTFAFFDFGVRRRQDLPMQGAYFPAALIRSAGAMRVDLKVVKFDHEEILNNQRLVKLDELAPTFRRLVDFVVEDARRKREESAS